jgi:CubicO group peptidase (beta-lactamase class C family)
MHRRDFMTTAATVPLLAAVAPRAGQAVANARGAPLNAMLNPYLARYRLPALAVAVVHDGILTASGAVGTRRAGTDIPVTIEDRFHIGSDTKAMTALLAATFVEQGHLRWTSTLGGVFPELAATMDAGLKGVTLEQLLSHTSGIPSDNETALRLIQLSFAQGDMNLDELRYWLVKQWSTQPLQSQPGMQFAYSNIGYTLAGAMLERLGESTWEELLVGRVLDPLGLASAGFGPQASLGRVDAPLGHLVRPDGTLKPMLAGPDGDNPELLAPAGTVHLSVLDFAAWAGWNAGEGRRDPPLVRPETLRKLHTKVIEMPPKPGAPPGTPSHGGYGLGWGTLAMPFSPEPFVFHGGSNTMNLAYIMLQPAADFGMVLMTNVGGETAEKALMAAADEVYKHYAPAH